MGIHQRPFCGSYPITSLLHSSSSMSLLVNLESCDIMLDHVTSCDVTLVQHVALRQHMVPSEHGILYDITQHCITFGFLYRSSLHMVVVLPSSCLAGEFLHLL